MKISSAIFVALAAVPVLIVGSAALEAVRAMPEMPEVAAPIAGTLSIAAIALLVAVPFGLVSAIYLAEIATPLERRIFRPLFAALASVPGVAFGWAALWVVGPALRTILPSETSQLSLSAGLVLGVVLIPVVSSFAQDAISSVPRALREAGWALGGSELAVITRVVLPAAKTGLVAAVLLAASRGIGETMIVWIAAGSTRSLTGAMAHARLDGVVGPVFAMSAALLALTIGLNAIAHRWVQKTRSWI